MPGNLRHKHTPKAGRTASHIERSAREEGRYRGRERQVAWASVHQEMSKDEAHGKRPTRRTTERRNK